MKTGFNGNMTKRKPVPYEDNHKTIDDIIYKLCSDCDKWLPMAKSFYKNKSAPDGHNPYCKDCTKKRSSKWKDENKEQYNELHRKSYLKNKGIDNKKARDQRWRDNGGLTKWQRNNPDRMKLYRNDRALTKKHEITDDEWENCKNYFNYRCAYCDLPIEEHYIKFRGNIILSDFHREHVSDIGTNDLSNCIPSCKICNTSKHTFTLAEWYNESNINYTKERYNKITNWLEDVYKIYIKLTNK